MIIEENYYFDKYYFMVLMGVQIKLSDCQFIPVLISPPLSYFSDSTIEEYMKKIKRENLIFKSWLLFSSSCLSLNKIEKE